MHTPYHHLFYVSIIAGGANYPGGSQGGGYPQSGNPPRSYSNHSFIASIMSHPSHLTYPMISFFYRTKGGYGAAPQPAKPAGPWTEHKTDEGTTHPHHTTPTSPTRHPLSTAIHFPHWHFCMLSLFLLLFLI